MARAFLEAFRLPRHCEERSDEAIHPFTVAKMDCFASLAMTAKANRLTFASCHDVFLSEMPYFPHFRT
jgi:hypothetical protein